MNFCKALQETAGHSFVPQFKWIKLAWGTWGATSVGKTTADRISGRKWMDRWTILEVVILRPRCDYCVWEIPAVFCALSTSNIISWQPRGRFKMFHLIKARSGPSFFFYCRNHMVFDLRLNIQLPLYTCEKAPLINQLDSLGVEITSLTVRWRSEAY